VLKLKNIYWEKVPLRNQILVVLIRRQGVILEDELFTILKKDYPELSYPQLNKSLMNLEINGIIHVSQITKSKRKVEIIKEGQEFLAVGED
jgi:Fe2+ or Zn2+ uptake regulation protein